MYRSLSAQRLSERTVLNQFRGTGSPFRCTAIHVRHKTLSDGVTCGEVSQLIVGNVTQYCVAFSILAPKCHDIGYIDPLYTLYHLR
jgi:hypothetical protein